MRRLPSCIVIACALAAAACAPETPTGPKSPRPASIVAEPGGAAVAGAAIAKAMAADSVPAMSVAVIRGDEIIWTQAFGTANLETRAPATRETRFRIGSISKLFAADLAAILAAEGAVDLDADIRTYLPQFPDKGAAITLRQLLGHLGGIRHYAEKDHDFTVPGGPIDVRMYPDVASILAVFADDPLVAAPGEKYVYSTFGYALAGLVLEAAARQSFADLVNEKIFAPADIIDIAVDDMFAIVPDRGEFYDPIDDYDGLLAPEKYGKVVNAFFLNSAYKIAAGGYVADAEAIARFGALHFAPGFLSDDVYAEVFRKQHTNAGEETDTGLGWRVAADAEGRRLLDHTGSQQGSRAYLAVYPDEKLSVAILSNMGGRPDDIRALGAEVAAPFLDR